jgi:hypothetical protein
METAASFEARFAPSSYPTNLVLRNPRGEEKIVVTRLAYKQPYGGKHRRLSRAI